MFESPVFQKAVSELNPNLPIMHLDKNRDRSPNRYSRLAILVLSTLTNQGHRFNTNQLEIKPLEVEFSSGFFGRTHSKPNPSQFLKAKKPEVNHHIATSKFPSTQNLNRDTKPLTNKTLLPGNQPKLSEVRDRQRHRFFFSL